MDYKDEEYNLFVPGRLGIVGELSDWVCDYKNENDSIVCGEAIAVGIDKGIYATVKKSDKFIFNFNNETFEVEMDNIKLEKYAKSDSFYSYICAVALYMNKNYDIGGINIEVRCMTLPIKKGLSSSAAVSVLVAKSFNIIYDLDLEFYELMKIAYESEHLALSKCGRLDQICAKGLGLSHFIFNKDSLYINQIELKSKLHFVVADLDGKKDTKKILSTLHSCFPFPKSKVEEKVKEVLCEKNKSLVKEMVYCMKNGDLEKIGRLMSYSQRLIDDSASLICTDLKAPILHKIMEDSNIKMWSYGARGIGTNGDGSIEILAKNEKCQKKIEEYLMQEYNMKSFSCNINPTHKVKKAVIPIAGFGTKVYPFTRTIKKSFLPIVDNGYVKPVILKLIEELDEAGIEEIALVVAKDEEPIYNDFFKNPISNEHFNKLTKEAQEYELKIQRLGEKIKYIVQEEQLGYGHAVWLSRKFAAGKPVLVILGDTIYKSKIEKSCTEQLLEYYDRVKKPVISLNPISDGDFENYAIVHGAYYNNEKDEISIKGIVEKINSNFKENNLGVNEKYFSLFGQSIIDSAIYDALEYNVKNNIKSSGEIQFTDALDMAIKNNEVKGFVVKGKQYDLGISNGYAKAINAFQKDFEEDNLLEEINDIISFVDMFNEENSVDFNNISFEYVKNVADSMNNTDHEYKI